MTRRTVVAIVIGTVLGVSAVPARAQNLKYWGKRPGAPTGIVETAPGQRVEVNLGDEIPGWGRVKEIRDRDLIVERDLSDEEKVGLQSQGFATYDSLEIQILHERARMTPQ
jgi:hypothetical protein